MQKWCPDAFSTSETIVGGLTTDNREFQGDSAARDKTDDSGASRFRSETGFTDTQALLSHLTRQERTQLFELVEQDVSAEYEQREVELKAALETQIQGIEAETVIKIEKLGQRLDQALGEVLKEMSASTARLSIQLAEKIVRKTVDFDSSVLERALETTLYKLQDHIELNISLNPEDVSWFENQPELMSSLKINKIQSDRRIDKGGCVIKSGAQEWDATVSRQLESLTELVEEAISVANQNNHSLLAGESHEPEMG